MKEIIFSNHSLTQCQLRGADEDEVKEAINTTTPEQAKGGRLKFNKNFQFNKTWNDKKYAIKQVEVIVAEEIDKFVVVTVITKFF